MAKDQQTKELATNCPRCTATPGKAAREVAKEFAALVRQDGFKGEPYQAVESLMDEFDGRGDDPALEALEHHLLPILSRHFPPTETTQPAVADTLIRREDAARIAENWEDETKVNPARAIASGIRQLRSVAAPADAREVERLSRALTVANQVAVSRLTDAMHNEKENDQLRAELSAARAKSYAHTCRDGHHEIGFNDPDSEYGERCPLCSEVDRLVDGVRDHLVSLGVPDSRIDGAGCDSDDPLDFMQAEITQAFSYIEDQNTEKLAKARANAIRECCDAVRAMKNGYSVDMTTGELEPDVDGPWFLNGTVARVLESLAKEGDDAKSSS